MVRDEHLKGIGIVELSAYAPTEEAQATTDVTIQVNGKDLEGFKPDVTDYHLEYEENVQSFQHKARMEQPLRSSDAKSANAPFLSRLSQKMASSKKYINFLSPQKHLQAQPFLKKGSRIWFIPNQSW